MFSHSKIKLNLDLKTPIDFENTKYPEIGFFLNFFSFLKKKINK